MEVSGKQPLSHLVARGVGNQVPPQVSTASSGSHSGPDRWEARAGVLTPWESKPGCGAGKHLMYFSEFIKIL